METLRRAKNRRRFAMSLPSVDGLGIELPRTSQDSLFVRSHDHIVYVFASRKGTV